MLLKRISALLVGRNDLPQQFKRYVQTIAWIYRSVLKSRPGTTMLALATNFVGPVIMGVALTSLIYFAGLMESNTPLTLKYLSLTIEPRNPGHFAIVVILVGIMMLISGIIIFWANCISIRLAVSFARDQSRSVLCLQSGRPWRRADPVAGPYPPDVRRCAIGIVVLARAIRPLLQLIQPLVIFIFSFAALLYINTLLTIAVAALALPSLIFQYLINYTAAKNQELMGPALRRMQKGITKFLDCLTFSPQIHESARSFLTEEYEKKEIRELPERYITRILARPKSQAVSNIFTAILAVAIVAYLGVSALRGNVSWSLLLGYIVFVRTAMFGFSKLLGTITGFARHYLKARRSYELLTSGPRKSSIDLDTIKLHRDNCNCPGDLEAISLSRGKILGVLSPVPFTRYNTYAWADALTSKEMTADLIFGAMVCVSDAVRSCPGGSLRELLGLDPELSVDQVIDTALRLENEVDLSKMDVDTILDSDTWKTLPVSLRCHLLLDMVVRSKGDIILVEHNVLKGAREWYLKDWWTKAADRFVLVRYNNFFKLGTWGEKNSLAMRTDRMTALMSVEWAKQNKDSLKTWIAEAKSHDDEGDDFDMADDD